MIGTQQGAQKKKKAESPATSFVRYTNQVANTVLRGIKMATPEMYEPSVSPMKILDFINKTGLPCLGWRPETFFSHVDKTVGGWTSEMLANGLEKFHSTGIIHTDVPELVRQKVYAIRIIMTSDTAHREWHVFEKVGSVFNGRNAHFGVVEPLSPMECAKTIAIIDAIRPDEFSHEIKAYVAAACHQDGLYTVRPSKYLSLAEELLAMLNKEETGRPTNDKIVQDIASRMETLPSSNEEIADFIGTQAAKLIAADSSAADAIKD